MLIEWKNNKINKFSELFFSLKESTLIKDKNKELKI